MSMSWEENANEYHNLKLSDINIVWAYFLKKTTSTNELRAD